MFQRLKEWVGQGLKGLMENREGQISALDGLRAFAITVVIASHCKNDLFHAIGKQQPSWFFSSVGFGWSGVDLFFVLSGFLIGKILFQEIRTTGGLEVGPFLLKRGFRIWPLYFFICGLGFVQLLYSHHVPPITELIPDLLFLTNYYGEKLAYGSWSLSTEEQFYLIASVMLFFSMKWIGHIKHIFFCLITLFLIAPFMRMLVWDHYIGLGTDPFFVEWEIIHGYFITHYEGLVIGVLFAAAMVFTPPRSWIRSKMLTFLLLGIAAASVLTAFDHIYFLYSLVTLVFGAAVWYCLDRPNSVFAKFFAWPGFMVVSRLSYGMYLWYRFPLWRIADFVTKRFGDTSPVFQYTLIFGLAFAAAAFAATVTFILVERPFLQLRSRVFAKKVAAVERIEDGRLDYS